MSKNAAIVGLGKAGMVAVIARSLHMARSANLGFDFGPESCDDGTVVNSSRSLAPLLGPLLLLGACSFSASIADDASRDGPGTSDGPKQIDAVPVPCGGIDCGANSACVNNACTCEAGFGTPTATGCSDINECAADGACAADAGQCVNTVGSFECYKPATCAAVKAKTGANTDGDYTLYIGGDGNKPWTAYCADMNMATPLEFLTLPASGNTAMYKAGGGSSGNTVITTYQRVRLDPATLQIATGNQRFATSEGSLTHSNSGTTVTTMPYATAMSCKNNGDKSADAFINLTGTRFHETQQFEAVGNNPGSDLQVGNNQQTLKISGGGFCGWNAPTGSQQNPFNLRGTTLQLAYQ